MGEDKIQKGPRRDGTEVASGNLSVVMKRIRGQSSKRTQSRERRQEKMCSGMHNQEYPTQTRGIPPSTPSRDCQGHSGRWLLVTTLKKDWNSTEMKGREIGFKKCLTSLMN